MRGLLAMPFLAPRADMICIFEIAIPRKTMYNVHPNGQAMEVYDVKTG